MRCDDYCCNHGCNQGRNCVARKTPAAQRAIEEQAKTDRQGDNLVNEDSSWNLIDLVFIVGAVAIIGLVLAPYAAGYLSHMQWK